MRVTCDEPKRKWTLAERGLDMLRASDIFAGLHLTRPDDRLDYGEARFVTVGELVGMRHCHEREAQKIRTALAAL